jgi:predicted metal-dependent phosphoesterase TrpH
MLLKADFHIHTREDPHDFIRHTALELLAEAARQGFDVIALTCHNKRIHSAELARRAEDLGILLIPGVEAAIEGKHTLLLDMPYSRWRVRRFDQVRALRRDGGLVIAPHPFFPAPK